MLHLEIMWEAKSCWKLMVMKQKLGLCRRVCSLGFQTTAGVSARHSGRPRNSPIISCVIYRVPQSSLGSLNFNKLSVHLCFRHSLSPRLVPQRHCSYSVAVLLLMFSISAQPYAQRSESPADLWKKSHQKGPLRFIVICGIEAELR